MTRLFTTVLTIALTLLLQVAFGAEFSRPNILWIVTDDHRSDSLACYNRATTGRSESALGYVESPNVDKLASEGVLFTGALAATSICCASDISLKS